MPAGGCWHVLWKSSDSGREPQKKSLAFHGSCAAMWKAAAAAMVASAAAELSSLRLGHEHFGEQHMERSFLQYAELPVGEAALKAKGWHKQSEECNPNLGYAWTERKEGSTKQTPLVLYTTKGGQPAGVGITMVGYGSNPPLPTEQQAYATSAPLVPTDIQDLPYAHVDVAFRSGAILCSGQKEDAAVGDTLIVNPTGPKENSVVIPFKEAAAKEQGWHRGSCFDGMGWHWFLDTLKKDGSMSFTAQHLFPVVAMYHEGDINAIFFVTHVNQVSVPFLAANEWDPSGLDSANMCRNTCDKDCSFTGMVDTFSTAHVYFRDHKEVTCPAELHCGITFPLKANCCEATQPTVVV